MNIIHNLTKIFARLIISKTARNTYLVFLGNGLSAFFAFLFTVSYARNLSFTDIGYFSAMLSLLLLISDLADTGIGTSLSTFLPPLEERKEQLFAFLKTAFLLQVGIAFVSSGIIFLFSSYISNLLFHSLRMNYLIKIVSLGIFFTILANFGQYALAARQKFLAVSFLSAFGSIIRLLLFIILIVLSIITLPNLVYLQTLSQIILLAVTFAFLSFNFMKVNTVKSDLKKLISFTYLLGLARGLTALAGRLDVLMIVSIKNPSEAGIYAIASRIIAIYPLLAGSFSTVIAPRLSVTREKADLKAFMIKVTLATLAIVGTIILLIIFAGPFMVILFADKGELAISVFRLLLISMIFFVGSVPAVSLVIYYLKKPYVLTINSVLQLIIVVIGNLIFIPKFGRFGAAYSLILAYGITLILTSVLTYYHYKQRND